MTFKQFLEQGTQGEGPTASGQRGSSGMSASATQAQQAINPNQKPTQKEPEGGKFGGGVKMIGGKNEIPGEKIGGGGIGKPPQPPAIGMSGAGKYPSGPPALSPLANSLKYAKPQNVGVWPIKK